MTTAPVPSEVARDALRMLAQRRMPPTPENFRRVYEEIAGIQTPELRGREGATQLAKTVRDLLRQWDLRQSGLTPAKKREALERVLASFATDPLTLVEKLDGLIRHWAGGPLARPAVSEEELADALVEADAPAPAQARETPPQAGAAAPPGGAVEMLSAGALAGLFASALEDVVVPRLTRFPDLADEARALAAQARQLDGETALGKLTRDIRNFSRKVALRTDDDGELLHGLHHLLQMVANNLGELLIDDKWVAGQVTALRGVLDSPLSVRMLDQAERSLKDLIFKQGAIKHSLEETRAAMKNLVATFIDRVSQMTDVTGQYHDRVEVFSRRIRETDDLALINRTLEEFLVESRSIQTDMMRSRDELIVARKSVMQAEERIQSLEAELEKVSELVREDFLTGSLNRRGMDEAFERELARADRRGTPLCVALMDIDHFKNLNDTYGHDAGDNALVHIVQVVNETLRPTDVVARFGGEEFVIILPDTPAAEAARVMTRVQRDLTRKIFLHENERVLITFSAGVAERKPGEMPDAIIARADKALYRAKEAGRNRVIAAE